MSEKDKKARPQDQVVAARKSARTTARKVAHLKAQEARRAANIDALGSRYDVGATRTKTRLVLVVTNNKRETIERRWQVSLPPSKQRRLLRRAGADV